VATAETAETAQVVQTLVNTELGQMVAVAEVAEPEVQAEY
jgi:hypothetical protein